MAQHNSIRHRIFGAPISNKHALDHRLIVPFGLAVLAADALSSVAYASEEILHVLHTAGNQALPYVFPVSIALVTLIIIVAVSYRQTIRSYPQGGGTYIVASENLGRPASLLAAAALLTDYILTVAVSLSSGAAAVVSMVPSLQPYIVGIAVGAAVLVGYANLRGLKESGTLFSIPTYGFIVLILGLIVTALIKGFGEPAIVPRDLGHGGGGEALVPIGLLLLVRAFSQGCTALTGIEAISDGVQTFKPPESRNANKALAIMAGLLAVMFLGVSWSAAHYGAVPMRVEDPGYRSVVAQVALQVFGDGTLFFAVQVFTALILLLAANTAYADFPRLASFVARDKYLPRQLRILGDRLVFHNGILLLTLAAIVLIIAFRADTHLLVPLYAVGVFVAFTISQSGMARKSFREGNRGRAAISAFGASVTGIVAVILLVTKFTQGAWLVIVVGGALIVLFSNIRKHYLAIDRQMTLDPDISAEANLRHHRTVVLVPRLHAGAQRAMAYATVLKNEIQAVHVQLDPRETEKLQTNWQRFYPKVPLIVLESPYRSVVQPLDDYLSAMASKNKDMLITVIVPHAVPFSLWEKFLHGDTSRRISRALVKNRQVVVTRVPYFLTEDSGELPGMDEPVATPAPPSR